jgi:ATP adenylyltransferase
MNTDLRFPVVKRFDWIVRGGKAGPDPICDVPVRSTPEAVAIPTIGAILPNWLLIVPRMCAASIADTPPDIRRKILCFGDELAREMHGAGEPVIFEHGARKSGNVVGCGVDQAHLHVLATEIDLLRTALGDKEVLWSVADPADPWRRLDASDYYLIQTSNEAFIGHALAPQSQYFRKLIARAAGVPFRWDYKVWPNYENARRTYGRFAEGAACAANA